MKEQGFYPKALGGEERFGLWGRKTSGAIGDSTGTTTSKQGCEMV